MDTLPVELLINIVTRLNDVSDILAVRLTCKVLRDACMSVTLPLEWPRGQSDVTNLPWQNTRSLCLNNYTPVPFDCGNTKHIALQYYDCKNLFNVDQLTNLSINHFHGAVDLRAFVNLEKLVLYFQYSQGHQPIYMPPNVIDVVVSTVYDPVNFTQCVKLQKVRLVHANIRDYKPLARVPELELQRIKNVELKQIAHVDNLTLNACNFVTYQNRVVLYGHTFTFKYCSWIEPPELPNMRSLNYIPLYHETGLNCATAQLTHLNLECRRCEPLEIQNWTNLQSLYLDVDIAGNLPDMPNLTRLELNCCSLKLPVSAPNLQVLELKAMKIALAVTKYPKLHTLGVSDARLPITIQNLQHLRSLELLIKEPCVDLVGEFPLVHKLVLQNQSGGIYRFTIPFEMQLKTAVFENVTLFNLKQLTSLQNCLFYNCTFVDIADVVALVNVPRIAYISCDQITNVNSKARTIQFDHSPIVNVDNLFMARSITVNHCTKLQTCPNLPYLHTLHMLGTSVKNLTPLTDHKYLRHLTISETDISDLTPLASIPTLLTVIANRCKNIKDVSALAHVRKIELCDNTRITDVTCLSQCQSVELICCTGIPVEQIEFLKLTVPRVEYLYFQ